MYFPELIEKIASSDVTLNPAVLDVIRRVRTVGLNKTAAAMQGTDEVTLKSAVQALGTKLAMKRARHEKIAAALIALQNIDE